jgi:dUTP pyrophosphatase
MKIVLLEETEDREDFIPTVAKPGDVGMDLRACIRKPVGQEAIRAICAYRRVRTYSSDQGDVVYKHNKTIEIYEDGEPLVTKDMVNEEAKKRIEDLLYSLERSSKTVLLPTSFINLLSSESFQECAKLNTVIIPTGIKVELPKVSLGEEYICSMDIASRSGFGIKHGLVIAHGVGTIDSGYRGEVLVALRNVGQNIHIISRGTKIAQAKLSVNINPQYLNTCVVNELSSSERGEGKLGSTGLR